MHVCVCQRGKERISNLSWIQGSLTSVSHVMLDLKRLLLTRCEKLETPLRVREMLMRYKHEQQLFKNFLYEAALRGPGQELEESLWAQC